MFIWSASFIQLIPNCCWVNQTEAARRQRHRTDLPPTCFAADDGQALSLTSDKQLKN